jgi:A/G-specific adenine glycosylase
MEISKQLQAWYNGHKRDLMWRNTNDAYKIWLSEIILQQTQVIQGTSYYLKFIEKYPTVKHLASASEEAVMKLWQGLGYYSRARNLHAAAKYVMSHFKGQFPTNYADIITLKGVGNYTASAIASIAFNEAKAVVDGNVYRVLARLFDVHTPIDSNEGKKAFQILADELLDHRHPGNHNQAMMELGALCCKPSSPNCNECPISINCMALKNGTINELPVKSKKVKIRERYLDYIVIEHKGGYYLQKRTAKDIWQNMYEFYLIENPQMEDEKKGLKAYCKALSIEPSDFIVKSVSPYMKHVLTHQLLHARFHHIELKKTLKTNQLPTLKKYKIQEFEKLAFPRLIDKFVKDNLI